LVLNVQRPTGSDVAPAANGDLARWPAVKTAVDRLAEADVRTAWLVCQAGDVGRTMRAVADQAHAATVVLGWHGKLRSADGAISNAMLRHVLQDPPADVIVVGGQTATRFDRILVPYAGGPHSELALRLGLDLARSSQAAATPLTALHVVADAGAGPAKGAIQTRQAALDGAEPSLVRSIEAVHHDAAAGILDELSQGYDAVIMGTSREEVIDQVLFGVLPQRVADESNAPVLVVRRRSGFMPRLARGVWRAAFAALPTLSPKEQAEVSAAIRKGATAQADFYVMIALSTIIAALGLLLDSPAVVIGAMLVAPLMAAIIGMALGIVHGDQALLLKSARTSAAGIAIAVAIGLIIGWLAPGANITAEVMARTAPNLLDLFVALAAGAAGAYALCRKEVAASLAGVAIAVALVPPLATVGITLSMMRFDLAAGSSLLFTTNLVAIAASGAVVFLLLGFAPPETHKRRRATFWRSLAGIAALLLAIGLILGTLTWQSLNQVRIDRALQAAIQASLDAQLEADLLDASYRTGSSGVLTVEATVRTTQQIPEEEIAALQQDLANRLDIPVAMRLTVLPAVDLPAVAPFTQTTPTP
jgi:uncharacterized hydrophobic protein (TIGR00271 family)